MVENRRTHPKRIFVQISITIIEVLPADRQDLSTEFAYVHNGAFRVAFEWAMREDALSLFLRKIREDEFGRRAGVPRHLRAQLREDPDTFLALDHVNAHRPGRVRDDESRGFLRRVNQ